ncbi:MAG: SusC/RagA family TonB-linked outer membrane protein, partial [Bacteroidota bacterium]
MKKFLLLSFMLMFTFASSNLWAQERTVSGKVTSVEDGSALPGVNVVLKGTTAGTVTDIDGNYSLSVPSTGGTLVFSFIGLASEEVEIGARSVIDLAMSPDVQQLSEVVVTGYSGTSKENLTSSIKTVNSDIIEDFNPSLSVDNMLQGQAAGVAVTGANGQPGNRAFIRIRGISSIQGGQDPLYIVDGVPLDATNINNINPGDIESINVLKDAASSALYGSRAGNGVIVITTKKGRSGNAQITFRSSIGFGERIPDNFDMMNTEDRFRYESELADLGVAAAQGAPGGGGFSPDQTDVFRSIDTDWEDEILRNARISNYSLGISGGDDKMNYFLSMAYDENTGIVDNISGFNRYSARLNTLYQARDWLNIQSNISISRAFNDLPRDRNNVQNPNRAFYDYLPYASVFQQNPDGSLILDGNGDPIFNQGLGTGGFNIIEALRTNPEESVNLVTIGNVAAEATFLGNFTNRLTIGVSNDRFTRSSFLQPGNRLDFFVGDADNPGSKTDNGSNDFRWVLTNVLSYKTTLREKHDLSLNALVEYNKREFSNYTLTSIGFPTDRLDRQAIAAQPTNASTNGTSNALLSFGGFLDYNFDSKYLFSASLRTDGSSRFGADNRWGVFWSVSAGWNIANESFFNVDFINALKLRASYGLTGNQLIGDFTSLERVAFGSRNGSSTALPEGIADTELGWEEQLLTDIGIDFTMFDGKLNGTIDYFDRTSTELLNAFPLSRSVGDENNQLTTNFGEIQSTGFEFELSYDIVRKNDFNVSVGGNAY